MPVFSGELLLGLLFIPGAPHVHALLPDRQMLVAGHLEAALSAWHAPTAEGGGHPAQRPVASGALAIRYNRFDGTVLADGEYLIRGVAGAVLWKVLNDYVKLGRRDFSYRELRLTPGLRLPDGIDNLGARLILLRKRLRERCPDIRIEGAGRGRFSVAVAALVRLEEQAPATA